MEGNREVLWREIAEPVKKVKEKEVEVEVVNMIHKIESRTENMLLLF